MGERVLAVAVHPDDETLAFGGTLLKHKAGGDEIFWLILTAMDAEYGFAPDEIQRRGAEIERVSREYGFTERFELGFPATALDTFPLGRIVGAVSKILTQVQPTILYLPNSNDVHSDHRIGFEALWSAAKSFRQPSIRKILMGETTSETEFAPPLQGAVFSPNYFVDVTDYFDQKLKTMDLYQGQLGEHPFPRSRAGLKALAALRGARCGADYAEAFMLLFQKA